MLPTCKKRKTLLFWRLSPIAQPFPEIFAIQKMIQERLPCKGVQTMAFWALPPSHIMDKPSWDQELLLQLANQCAPALPRIWNGWLSLSTACQSFNRSTARHMASFCPHNRYYNLAFSAEGLSCKEGCIWWHNPQLAEVGGGSPGAHLRAFC